jgi:hypothetical protein
MTEAETPDQKNNGTGVLARPTAELRAEALRVLGENGWSMNQFLIASLEMVTRNPHGMLGSLARFKPPPGKPGRPRRDQEGKTP